MLASLIETPDNPWVTYGTWVLTLIALVGMYLNSRLNRWGFACWTLTNSSWIIVGFCKSLPALSAQNAVYLYFSITGFMHWTRKHHVLKAVREHDAKGRGSNQRVPKETHSSPAD